MDRRWWGTAVVVLGLLAAVVVPNLSGRRIDGAGSRVPIPDPPVVGQCLLTEPNGQHSALSFSQVEVDSSPVGPCAQENYGEVVSVTTDHHDFPATVINRVSRPETLACQLPARGYLGWDVRPETGTGAAPDAGPDHSSVVVGDQGVPDRILAQWRPVTTQKVGLLGPSLSQYLSGQTWIACVVLPRFAPYAGAVRGGAAGTAAGAYGSCVGVTQPDVSCGEPHVTEIFGVASRVDTDPDVLAASCRQLVVEASGMTDPTANGALRVGVQVGGTFGAAEPSNSAEPGTAPPTGSEASAVPGLGEPGPAVCVVSVAGSGQLGGSLTGIGDGPLPWA